MKRKKIVLNKYKKYWIEDTKKGHLIKICYGDKDQTLELNLCWDNGVRDKSNRVTRKYSS
tara:strand:+ start:456 stop:635 length:180 start_codon:yes stop_codon:yes gene_type:complete